MFFAERIKQWLRPRPPGLDVQPKEEAQVLSTKIDIGQDVVPGGIKNLRCDFWACLKLGKI